MKVFLIGGVSDSQPRSAELLASFCQTAGQLLASSDHHVVLCSCREGSADRAILEAMAKSPNANRAKKLIVHRPDDATIREEWRELCNALGFKEPVYHDHRGPELRSGPNQTEALRLAFLLCQLKALD